MKVLNVFGTTTSRYNSSVPSLDDEYKIDVPLGPCIARFDIQKQEREMFLQAHSDVITFMQRSPFDQNHIVTCSNGGEIKLWDKDWRILTEINVGEERLTNAEFSKDGNHIVVTCEEKGTIHLIEINYDKDISMRLVNSYCDSFCLATINPEGQILAVKQQYTKKDSGCNLVLLDSFKVVNKLCLVENDVISLLGTTPDRSKIILCSLNRSRYIYIIDSSNLKIISQFLAKGSGGIQALMIEDDKIYIPSQNGILFAFKMDGSLQSEHRIPSGSCYNIDWANKENSTMWITMEGELHHYNLITGKDHDISYHSLTCCGVDIDTEEKYIVSGDFLGNVILWDIKTHKSLAMISLFVSIRCISWKHDSSFVQIGCMDGSLWNWDTKTQESQQVATLDGSIICIDWERGNQATRVAIGTSNGYLYVLDNEWKTIKSFLAHEPVDNHQNKDQFGSIHHFSEIWSLKWSPDNNYIATSSEDQSTRIWNLKGEKLHVLTGHTTAVTGVDWSLTSNEQVLITCADDKKVMVWDAKTWNLLHEFKSDVLEWHTLTYLAIEEGGSRFCVATQNGYLVLYSLEKKSVLLQKKLHNGSIEGLKWRRNHIVTCSSDCTVTLFNTIDKK